MRILSVISASAIGVTAALGGYTFVYARGYSYLTNDPRACANCHIMQNHYSAWLKSSHRAAAACNDCHTPPGLIPKYMVKAENGFRHSFAFTTGRFPEPLRITPADRDVTERACRKCHEEIVIAIEGQCHVEYYFKGPEKRLVYPWAKGLKIDDILAYYEENPHTDWTHAETGAPVLKAQHPEFEMWNQGIHARSGVACADCHMPYTRVGSMKISDHHVRSPVLNINHACQTCHHWPEEELKARVEIIQGRVFGLRNRAMDAVVGLIEDIRAARGRGVPDDQLAEPRRLQRRAQFMLDFVEAENSTGFHAPEEAERILAESIDYARQGQLVLLRRERGATSSRFPSSSLSSR